MGEGDIYYDTWDRYKYITDFGDYNPYNELEEFIGNTFLTEHSDRELYEDRVKKFDEILYDVLLDFAGSGIKIFHPNLSNINIFTKTKTVVEKIIIEGNDKKTSLTYNPETHEISGLVWMPLGERDLTEITEDEVKIIQRALLIWIYENV